MPAFDQSSQLTGREQVRRIGLWIIDQAPSVKSTEADQPIGAHNYQEGLDRIDTYTIQMNLLLCWDDG